MLYRTVVSVFHRGIAVAKARPSKRFGQAKSFTPEKTRREEASFGELVAEAMAGRDPLPAHVPLCVRIIVIRPRPASAKKTQLYPTARPDTDNYVKLYLDAMNGVVYMDDSGVVQVDAWKVFGPVPGVFVEVLEVDGVPLDYDDLRGIALGDRICSSSSLGN